MLLTMPRLGRQVMSNPLNTGNPLCQSGPSACLAWSSYRPHSQLLGMYMAPLTMGNACRKVCKGENWSPAGLIRLPKVTQSYISQQQTFGPVFLQLTHKSVNPSFRAQQKRELEAWRISVISAIWLIGGKEKMRTQLFCFQVHRCCY